MHRISISALASLFLGAMMLAHPAVAGALERSPAREATPAATTATATSAPQLPRIDAAVTRPMPPALYASAMSSDDVMRMVNARLALYKANNAIGWALLGLFSGPFILISGLNLMVVLVTGVAGLLLAIWGAAWIVASIPVLIGGIIGAVAARATLEAAKNDADAAAALRGPGAPAALGITVATF